MAHIQTESVVITFNKLVKNGAEHTEITSEEIVASLEAVAQELVGDGVIVEVAKA